MKVPTRRQIHRPLLRKGWRAARTLNCATTDDNEVRIITIFTHLVIFMLFPGFQQGIPAALGTD